ncbi:hypothetical protein [Pseudobutyrivibrio sp. ACV-2]|uniref:hypothetical protein n=1 Tax=Pseudobutyrivibrio sp. ACV-2 TaxID=1520801 RepID=UPI001479F537|nr:hypothetical protein [Pseudobutyrivibrio sp. ACV-2]
MSKKDKVIKLMQDGELYTIKMIAYETSLTELDVLRVLYKYDNMFNVYAMNLPNDYDGSCLYKINNRYSKER